MNTAKAAVLVIDDDPELTSWVSNELGRRGFAVTSASSGRMALEIQARHRFDLALIDLRMPGMDGIQTLTALKKHDPDIEAVIATGYGTIPTAVSSIKQGAFDFIQKPYTLTQLIPLLERALEKSRTQGTLSLREAGESLLAVHDEASLLDHASLVARRMLGAGTAAFFVRSSGRTEIRPDPNEFLDPDVADSLRELVHSAPGDAQSEPSLLTNPLGSVIVVPLQKRGESLGRAVLFRDAHSAPYTVEDLRRVGVFAEQLAHALDYLRLHDELQSKVQEVLRTREALVFAERLALTGQLTASVAHEINTPLTFVRFNLDYVVSSAEKLLLGLAAEDVPPESVLLISARSAIEELLAAASDARDGVQRIMRIVRDLNFFTQPTRDEPGRIELRDVLDWAAKVAGPQIAERSQLLREYTASPAIVGSESRLCQVFVNLIQNAVHAIPPGHPNGNRLTLRVRPDGSRVVAEVSDTGAGIDPAIVERIFEPFFTTKPAGIGTGLGLPICRGIITEHGGTLTVESTPGQGATFRVTLPAADELTPPRRDSIFKS